MNKERLYRYFEKGLIVSVMGCMMLLLFAQIGLFCPSTRVYLTQLSSYEGTQINEMTTGKSGKIVLSLLNSKPDGKIKVLLNGETVANFSEEKVQLSVERPSLIEIDGSNANETFIVKVEQTEGGITPDIMGKTVVVAKSIAVIGRVRVK